MALVTLKRFDDTISAHLMKARLESEGIESFLFDEHTVAINPLESFALGGIKLKIHERDKSHALRILEELEGSKLAHLRAFRCPVCGSDDLVTYIKPSVGIKSVIHFFISSIFAIQPTQYRRNHQCKICGKQFRS